MIPMDNAEKWLKRLDEEAYAKIFTSKEMEEWNHISLEEKSKLLKTMFEKPVDYYGIVYRWYFINKWSEAMLATKKKAPVRALEMASGANDVIPRTLSIVFNHPETTYITANSNKHLTEQFREATQDIPIKIDIIENNAIKIENYVQDSEFDIVAHEHSVNDIIYDMLCRKNGLDTVNTPWYEMMPDIVKFVNNEYDGGTLESSIKENLLSIFTSCVNVLKKDSFIIINHYMTKYDIDMGINYDFWENLLPMFRKWITEAKIGREICIDGFEPQWWMFIQKA